MVEILDLTILTDKRRLFEQMETKAIGCGTPLDWKLREPVEAVTARRPVSYHIIQSRFSLRSFHALDQLFE